MNLFNKIFITRRTFIDKFGLIRGYLISNKIYPKDKVTKPVNFYLSNYKRNVYLRTCTSDSSTFTKIFIDEEYDFKVNLIPEFIIDAGANIGFSSVFFAKKYPSALIYAVEPEKNNIRFLIQNTDRCNIKIFPGAIWNKETNLQIKNSHANTSGFEIIETDLANEDSIIAYTIGNLFCQSKKETIDILKIDIEGSEYEVFSSNFEEWLPKTKLLIIELHDRMKLGCTETLLKALSKYNFSKYEKGENEFWVNNNYNIILNL